jgi:hypothetical protein
MQPELSQYLPFCWWNNFNDTGLHSMFVNFIDEALEVAELVHGLFKQQLVFCILFPARHIHNNICAHASRHRISTRMPLGDLPA